MSRAEKDARPLELLIATGNRGKLREIEEALRGLPLRLRRLDEFSNIETVDEIGLTYRDNAILKALSYAKQTSLYALADDSGLEVEALGAAPGPLSARFAGPGASDEERTQKLLLTLASQSNSSRAARFVCFAALAGFAQEQSQSPEVEPHILCVTEGSCEGIISDEPRGSNGFGYDPIFVPAGYQTTFAELPIEIKNELSHRAKALAALRRYLERFLDQT